MNSGIKILILIFFSFAISQFTFSQEVEKEQKRSKKQKETQQLELSADSLQDQLEKCEVLLPSVAESYVGECKKGLAQGKGKAVGTDTYEGDFKKGYPHGTGIFEYESGDVYTGRVKMGLKDGEGEFATKIEGHDTVLTGIWMDDVYVGPKPLHPVVIYKYGIESYSIKNEREGQRFRLNFMMNGMSNYDLENFTIVSTSGTQFQMGNTHGFENVEFPVTCKVSYKTWNKLRTSRHEVIFEFKLQEPGDWMIRIIN